MIIQPKKFEPSQDIGPTLQQQFSQYKKDIGKNGYNNGFNGYENFFVGRNKHSDVYEDWVKNCIESITDSFGPDSGIHNVRTMVWEIESSYNRKYRYGVRDASKKHFDTINWDKIQELRKNDGLCPLIKPDTLMVDYCNFCCTDTYWCECEDEYFLSFDPNKVGRDIVWSKEEDRFVKHKNYRGVFA